MVQPSQRNQVATAGPSTTHLPRYTQVKGINWRLLDKESDGLLEKVKLTYAAKQRTGAYSGGMKRRLSVAIALLGDPKVGLEQNM